MREIKFRAWFTTTKEFASSVTVYNDGSWEASFDRNHPMGSYVDGGFSEKHGGILMQYTGLKDTKGKEIYEGDIVLQNSGSKAVIEWSSMASQWWMRYTKTASFRKDYKSLEPDYGDGQNYCQYIEVIGNIHENPELLS
jgi:uncharacterized phage protein (TIGR01671 family)